MNFEQALVDAIGKMSGRKNGAAIIGMAFLAGIQAPSWQIFGLAAGAILLQFGLDAWEVYRTGADQADNGNGNGGQHVETDIDNP